MRALAALMLPTRAVASPFSAVPEAHLTTGLWLLAGMLAQKIE